LSIVGTKIPVRDRFAHCSFRIGRQAGPPYDLRTLMSSTLKRSTKRTLLRLLLGIAVVLVLAAAAAGWWAWKYGEDWLEHTVRERVTEAIDEASVLGYRFTMRELHTDARQGRVVLSGAELDFAPELLDSLRFGSFRYLFAAKVERIELRGLSFWRLIWNGEFRVDAFELSEPTLRYLIGGGPGARADGRVSLGDPFSRLGQGGTPSISLLSADTLVVRNASAVMDDLGERLPVLHVSGLELQGSAVHVTMRERRGGVRLTVGGAELQLDSLGTQLGDGDQLSIGGVRLSRSRRSGHISSVRITSQRPDSTRTDLVRQPLLDLAVDSIRLRGLDVDRLIAEQYLRIDHMLIHGLQVQVELDKMVPAGEAVIKQLPPAALLAVSFPIRIDTLSLFDSEAIYDERDADTERWGVIAFTELNARFLHISNEQASIADHPRIEGEFNGMLFDSARVAGTYTAELDGSERFTFLATAAQLPTERLNSATRPLLRVQVNGGRLNRMAMSMEGDHRKARGTVALNYSDLLFRIEPGTPRELRHSMFGSVIETMLKESYGGGLSAERERSYSIDRDPHRSMITYIWHAAREGLARNLAPEAWERMRSMLRQDFGQMKEQRAVRKARRQGRK
jgi:hypothetical protein